MRRNALVAGHGVAALACAQLLGRRGWTVGLQGDSPGAGPTLVLGASTCDLLRHVFGDDVLAGAHRLAGRRVAWGRGAEPLAVAHPSLVIDQARLLASLRGAMTPGACRAHGDRPPDWLVDAGGRSSPVTATVANARRRTLGRRALIASDVTLTRRAPRDTSLVETVPGGWLFLAPRGADAALLQAMLPAPPAEPATALAGLLAESRLVAPAIAGRTGQTTVFSAAPRISAPLCGPGWIAVGDAAIALDPICGDGTGHGLRAALLAAAVLDAGAAQSDGLRHYEVRTRKAWLDHVDACVAFYSGGWTSELWSAEIAAMTAERDSAHARRIAGEPLRYGLHDEQLVAL